MFELMHLRTKNEIFELCFKFSLEQGFSGSLKKCMGHSWCQSGMGNTVGIDGREPGAPYVLHIKIVLYSDAFCLFSNVGNFTIGKSHLMIEKH